MNKYIKALKDIYRKSQELNINHENEVLKIKEDYTKSESFKKEAIQKLIDELQVNESKIRNEFTKSLRELKEAIGNNDTLDLSDVAVTNALKIVELMGSNITPSTTKDVIRAIKSNEGRLLVSKAIKNIGASEQVLNTLEANTIDYASIYNSIEAEGTKAMYTHSGNFFGNVLDYAEKKFDGEEVTEVITERVMMI